MKQKFENKTITIRSTDGYKPEKAINIAELNGYLVQSGIGLAGVREDGQLWVSYRHPSDSERAEEAMRQAEIALLRRYSIGRDPEAQVFVDGLSYGQALLHYDWPSEADSKRRKLERAR